jgi:lysine 2,3-aminomutase
MRHRVHSLEALQAFMRLTEDERIGIRDTAGVFRWNITPHYADLMDPDDPDCPIRRQMVPHATELEEDIIGAMDPLDEVAHSPVKNLIHNYVDRVAFCITSECAIYCRYCLRKRMVGDADHMMRKSEIREGLTYLRQHPEIKDVLLTGGDPLTFSDAQIAWLLDELRQIPHLEIIRIGSRLPVTLPQRFTPPLLEVLASHQPLWLNTHFNHAKELVPRVDEALRAITKTGTAIGNQTVLLKGVNDTVEDLRALFNGLVRRNVRPYYLYQAQVIGGTQSFRTPIEQGMWLMEQLQGSMTGFAIAKYVLDTPFGKVPLNRTYVLGRTPTHVIMRTTRDTLWAEPNPAPSIAAAWSTYLPRIAWPEATYTIAPITGEIIQVDEMPLPVPMTQQAGEQVGTTE